jgi:hypothetical protein
MKTPRISILLIVVSTLLIQSSDSHAQRRGKDFDSVFDDISRLQEEFADRQEGLSQILSQLTDEEIALLGLLKEVKGKGRDSDRDGRPDLLEFGGGICDSDSDDDGLQDGAEIGVPGLPPAEDVEAPNPTAKPLPFPYNVYPTFPYGGSLDTQCGALQFEADIGETLERYVGFISDEGSPERYRLLNATPARCGLSTIPIIEFLARAEGTYGCVASYKARGGPNLAVNLSSDFCIDGSSELRAGNVVIGGRRYRRAVRAIRRLSRIQRQINRILSRESLETRTIVGSLFASVSGTDSDADGLKDIFEGEDFVCDVDRDNDQLPDGVDFNSPNIADPNDGADTEQTPTLFSLYPNYPRAGTLATFRGLASFGHIKPRDGQQANEVLVIDPVTRATESVLIFPGARYYCDSNEVDFVNAVGEFNNLDPAQFIVYREGDGPWALVILFMDSATLDCPYNFPSRRRPPPVTGAPLPF